MACGSSRHVCDWSPCTRRYLRTTIIRYRGSISKGVAMSLCLGVPALLFTRFTGSLFNLARQPHDVTDIIDQHNGLYCFAIPASILLMQNMQLLSAMDNYS